MKVNKNSLKHFQKLNIYGSTSRLTACSLNSGGLQIRTFQKCAQIIFMTSEVLF